MLFTNTNSESDYFLFADEPVSIMDFAIMGVLITVDISVAVVQNVQAAASSVCFSYGSGSPDPVGVACLNKFLGAASTVVLRCMPTNDMTDMPSPLASRSVHSNDFTSLIIICAVAVFVSGLFAVVADAVDTYAVSIALFFTPLLAPAAAFAFVIIVLLTTTFVGVFLESIGFVQSSACDGSLASTPVTSIPDWVIFSAHHIGATGVLTLSHSSGNAFAAASVDTNLSASSVVVDFAHAVAVVFYVTGILAAAFAVFDSFYITAISAVSVVLCFAGIRDASVVVYATGIIASTVHVHVILTATVFVLFDIDTVIGFIVDSVFLPWAITVALRGRVCGHRLLGSLSRCGHHGRGRRHCAHCCHHC